MPAMRPKPLFTKPAFLCSGLCLTLALSACVEGEEYEELEQSQHAIVGDTLPSTAPHHEAVAAITILRPGGDEQMPMQGRENRYCTGVLISDSIVMTAASCIWRNWEWTRDPNITGDFLDEMSVTVQFGQDAVNGTKYHLDTAFQGGVGGDGPMTTNGVTLHRYFDEQFVGTNDVALLKLSQSPGITPVEINVEQE
jgi:hypothetical protein